MVTDLDRGHGAAIRRAYTRLPGSARNPVSNADWYDPVLNPKIQSVCGHYSTVVLSTKPYTPCNTGKIEKGIDRILTPC